MILVSLLLAGGAAATPPRIIEQRAETGSRLVTKNAMPSVVIDKQRATTMRRLTIQCLVARQPGVARRVIAASNEFGIDYARLGIPQSRLNAALSVETCMERSMDQGEGLVQWQLSDSAMRGFIVDALYRLTYKELPKIDWANATPQPVASFTTSGETRGASASTIFGECVVRTAPQQSDQFVRTEPGSALEASASASIAPPISQCLQAGSTLSLQKSALRVILADALWRFANGAPAASKTPGTN